MLNKDHEATAAAQFQDRRSEVLLDGRERLAGADLRDRREQVWERAGGRCEACGKPTTLNSGELSDMQMHHKKRRSQGRDDRAENLECLCFRCHSGEHTT